MLLRCSAPAGGTLVASQAGIMAAPKAAASPITPPFTRVKTGTLFSRTATTKKRSLTVCVTARTAPWPNTTPSPRPKTVPTNPSRPASNKIVPKISRRVMPRARRLPNTGRRCTTLKVTVL